jgi:hypothetical protein
MRLHDSEPGPDRAGLSAPTDDPQAERIAAALASGLVRLQAARPAFRSDLEARLLGQLGAERRPWWRRVMTSPADGGRRSLGSVRIPRRSFIGLAAASALVLAGASVSLPMLGTAEVSAREILEKVQANSENPVLAGVKSFHLTAKIWTNPGRMGKPHGGPTGPRELTTEQWFVAPDRMRSESRSVDSSGKPILSGMMSSGGDFKHYATEGASDVFMVSFFAMPIGAKPSAGGTHVVHDVREVRSNSTPVPGATVTAGTSVAGVRVAPPDGARGEGATFAIAVREDKGDGARDAEPTVYTIDEKCAEPKRTGESTIAGRAVFIVENDFSGCLPADAPASMKGKHVRWVDQKTYLPLKMEMRDQSGNLVDRYEVTSIEYDVEIAARTFTELPAGTKLQETKAFPQPPKPDDVRPANEVRQR